MKTPKEKKQRLTVFVDPKAAQDIKIRANREGTTLSRLVEKAISVNLK